ncbi:MAG: hypothetical protein JNL01_02455 [Bdellovibrionales bacterium]|nr:hypothetical protein [Bdellovibrionales bacterium]
MNQKKAAPDFSMKKRLRHAFPETPREDSIHLLLCVCLTALSDGKLEGEERSLVATFCKSIPEFKRYTNEELGSLIEEAVKVIKPYKDKIAALHALKAAKSARVREKCFILAMETALVTGHLSDIEITLLEKLQKHLELSDQFVEHTTELMVLKYR